MRIVYMGTPDFAVPAMERIQDSDHELICAVTRVDSRRDRGKKIAFSPVKAKATEMGIPVLQPEKIRGNDGFIDKMRQMAPDVIVVAAYGMILPKEILDIPQYGCINIHGSLLPRFRGAAPIQAAILEGDEETGITIMQMDEGLDTGDMLMKRSTPIEKKTAGMLHDELARMGSEMIVEVLDDMGRITAEAQDDSRSSYAPMIRKEDGRADFSLPPERIERMIRAFDPWPGTYTEVRGNLLKLWKAEVVDEECGEAAGTVVSAGKEGIDISCGGRIIRIEEVQAAGRKRVRTEEYLRGNPIEIGTILG